jgi:hemoglobin/transferrin/lactoferrin receptor protein
MKGALLILMILLCMDTSAQELDGSKKDTSVSLKEIYVNANKFKERRKNLAQHIDIISKKEIALHNPQTTADALSVIGKVYVQKSQQGGGSPVIRGFEASRVLLMLDGVRMNNAIYRAGHLQNIISTDPNIMEGIEVLNGPASTLYGSDALGGVVLMRTKDPVLSTYLKSSNYVQALGRYSSANNEMSANVHFNLANTRFASLTSFSYNNYGDVSVGKNGSDTAIKYFTRPTYQAFVNGVDTILPNPNRYKQLNSGFSAYHILQKLLWQQNENITHQLNLQLSNSSDIPRTDRLQERNTAGLPVHAEWHYGPQTRALAAYEFSAKDLHGIANEVQLTLSAQHIEESRVNRRFKNYGLQNRIEEVQVYGINLSARKLINKHEITYGADAQLNNVQSTAFKKDVRTNTISKLDTRYPDGKNNFNTQGIFVQHLIKLAQGKIIINDGLRFSATQLKSSLVDTAIQFKLPYTQITQSNEALTGNVGLIWMPNNEWRISGYIAGGFRAPNIDDLTKVFESVVGTQLIVPNPNIKPEYTRNYDLSISYNIPKKLFVETYIFNTQIRNIMQLKPAQFNNQDSALYTGVLTPVYALQNESKAYIRGLGVRANFTLATNWSCYTNYNYTYGRVQAATLVPLDHIPPAFGSTGIRFDNKKYLIDVNALFNGAKKLSDYSPSGEDNLPYATPNGLASWYTLNVKASAQLHAHIQVQTGVENITDNLYRTFASGFTAPGRSFMVALRWK